MKELKRKYPDEIGDAIKCFDCGEYSLLDIGGEQCLKCSSKNLTWINIDEPEMGEDRFNEIIKELNYAQQKQNE